MMPTITQLKDEIRIDPSDVGYEGKTAQEVANLMNSPREGVVIPQLVSVGDILKVFGMAAFRIAALQEPKKTGWLQKLGDIRSLKEGFVPSDPSVAALLDKAIDDEVILSEERQALEALGLRPGSRAEQLWGEGTYVALNDVANAI